MVYHEEEPEISTIYENVSVVSPRNVASKSRFVEDSKAPAAVPGLKLYRVVVVILGLLCIIQAAVNVSLPLALFNMAKNLTEERDELRRINSDIEASYKNLTEERDDLMRKLNSVSQQNSLTEERDRLNRAIYGCRMELEKLSPVAWMYFRGSFYHISSVKKTWEESRQECLQKDADLVIINSKEEQNFTRQFKSTVWIGLTDSETEGTWKWVDGTPVTQSFWGPGEPNGGRGENCGESKFDSENSWNDGGCSLSHFWMCEKKVLP